MLSGMPSINLIKVFQCIPKTADYQFGPRRLSSFGCRDRVTSRHRLTCSLFTANQFILLISSLVMGKFLVSLNQNRMWVLDLPKTAGQQLNHL